MKFTTHAAAREWSVDRRTLSRALAATGLECKKGAKFSVKQICRALYGDVTQSRTRETTARAELKEMEAAERRGELLSADMVRGIFRDTYQPIRSAILSLPNAYSAKANPSDPAYAHQALLNAVDEILPLIRKSLPKR